RSADSRPCFPVGATAHTDHRPTLRAGPPVSHLTARRQRRAVATAGTGLLLAAGLLAPAASAEVADLPEGVPSNELLLPHALDDRVADDGVTPIAVRATDAGGEEVVYGARPSTTPPVADLDADLTGTRY